MKIQKAAPPLSREAAPSRKPMRLAGLRCPTCKHLLCPRCSRQAGGFVQMCDICHRHTYGFVQMRGNCYVRPA